MRMRSIWPMVVVLAVVFWSASLSVQAEAGRPHPPERYLSPLKVAELMVAGKERIFLLDVRFAWEYADYHIPGAENISVQELAKPENLSRMPKRRKIVLYCRTGARADRALSILLSKGFEAYSIKGGIAAWWRDVMEPPSITLAPYGKQAALFRERQGLRNYFLNVPGAGAAFPTPPGPPIQRKAPEAPKATAVPPKEKPEGGVPPPSRAPAAAPDPFQNPCG